MGPPPAASAAPAAAAGSLVAAPPPLRSPLYKPADKHLAAAFFRRLGLSIRAPAAPRAPLLPRAGRGGSRRALPSLIAILGDWGVCLSLSLFFFLNAKTGNLPNFFLSPPFFSLPPLD